MKKLLLQALFVAVLLLASRHNPKVLEAWTAIPYIIAGASALYSGYSQNKARQQQGEQMKGEAGLAQQALPASKQLLQGGLSALTPGVNYYSGMLNDPRSATAPEQNRINNMYAGQTANVRNQFGRGGYGPAAAEQLRGQQRGATENVIQQGRPMAAGALSNLGSSMTGLGFQGLGLGAGILGNVFNQGMQSRQQSFNVGQASGQGLFGAYQQYLLGQALNQPGGTTPSPGPSISPTYQPPDGNSGGAPTGLYIP